VIEDLVTANVRVGSGDACADAPATKLTRAMSDATKAPVCERRLKRLNMRGVLSVDLRR
jgi:hypothetical protein